MSTTKPLSKGTLSLRFMQNAQRAKALTPVEPDRAITKDTEDTEWEVAREVWEAWGQIETGAPSMRPTIIYEASYIPFLFPSTRDQELVNKPLLVNVTGRNGRRTFGMQTCAADQPHATPSDQGQDEEEAVEPPMDLPETRPKKPLPRTISGFSSTPNMVPRMKNPMDSSMLAQNVIHDHARVGIDVRPPKPTHMMSTSEAGFIRPGVFATSTMNVSAGAAAPAIRGRWKANAAVPAHGTGNKRRKGDD